jgi:hypothetical protein
MQSGEIFASNVGWSSGWELWDLLQEELKLPTQHVFLPYLQSLFLVQQLEIGKNRRQKLITLVIPSLWWLSQSFYWHWPVLAKLRM